MAWSAQFKWYREDLIDKNGEATYTVEQVASQTAGKVRFKATITFIVNVVGYEGLYQGFAFKALDGTTEVFSTSKTWQATQGTHTAEYYFDSDNFTSKSWKFVYTGGEATKTVTPVRCYKASITRGNNLSSFAVNRTECPSGFASTGTIKDNGLIYYGDKLKVTYVPNSGYEAKVTLNSSAIASGATHIVSDNVTISAVGNPQATVSVFNGTAWNKYLVYIYDGSSWSLYQPMIYNGTAWDKYF